MKTQKWVHPQCGFADWCLFSLCPQIFCCHCCSFAHLIFLSAKLLLCLSFHLREAQMAKGKQRRLQHVRGSSGLTLATATPISGLLDNIVPECAHWCIQPLVLKVIFDEKVSLNSPQVSQPNKAFSLECLIFLSSRHPHSPVYTSRIWWMRQRNKERLLSLL